MARRIVLAWLVAMVLGVLLAAWPETWRGAPVVLLGTTIAATSIEARASTLAATMEALGAGPGAPRCSQLAAVGPRSVGPSRTARGPPPAQRKVDEARQRDSHDEEDETC
jgi:hypothetical protein